MAQYLKPKTTQPKNDILLKTRFAFELLNERRLKDYVGCRQIIEPFSSN